MNKKTIINLLLILGIFLIVYILYLLGLGVTCPFLLLTGFYCPGCGSTRMLVSICKLDFYQAFRYNPWLFIMIVGYLVFIIIQSIIYFKTKKVVKMPKIIINILLIVTLLYWVLRNIPYFSWLAPTIVN